MKKKEIYQSIGSMQQLASIRQLTFDQGQAAGMKAVAIKNGEMSLLVMADKCLDIAELSYREINFSFMAKQGLQGPLFERKNDADSVRSIMGGLFFTAGFENIGAPCKKDGRQIPLHGSLRLTPAEQLKSEAKWVGDDYILSVSGEIRSAALFGENIVLRRRIETIHGSKEITITDEIENEAFHDVPKMLLYHFNFGYPLLSSRGTVVLPSFKAEDRDSANYESAEKWAELSEPKENVPESVYLHELAENEAGETFAAYINPELALGVKLQFSKRHLPYFVEWKSLNAGDYALGLEPSNSHIGGRLYHEANGNLPMLEPFEKETIELKLTILDGKEELNQVVKAAEHLVEKGKE